MYRKIFRRNENLTQIIITIVPVVFDVVSDDSVAKHGSGTCNSVYFG